jgi:AraC-like DNA-binding protein
MPTPGPIRKEILSALENSILPALWEKKFPLGFITPELKFPAGIKLRHIDRTVPRQEIHNVDYPLQTRWPRANLHSSYLPYFGLIYGGIIEARTLVTQAQAKQYQRDKGIYAIRMEAPGIIIYPPGVARDGGEIDFWPDTTEPQMEMRSFWGSLHSQLGELLLHTHIRDAYGQRHISHSLQINDSAVISLSNLLMQEITNAPTENQDYPQAILLTLMLRIQKVLTTSQVKIANTSRSPIPLPKNDMAEVDNDEICRNCAIYIQMHLHEQITLTQIAKQANLSSAHLNRLFQQCYGVTIMRYVRQQRIAAAQKILEAGPENVAEIAALVGFKRASAFCDIFRRETGLTPSQYRRKARRNHLS